RSGEFVELRPVEPGFVLSVHKLVIDREDRERSLYRLEKDEAAVRRQLRPEPLDQRNKARLDKQQPVLRVIDDVDDLIIEQRRIDRMANRADAGDAVIKLEMAIGVPGERADPVARRNAKPQQSFGEAPRTLLGLGIAIAVNGPVNQARDDLDIAVKPR